MALTAAQIDMIKDTFDALFVDLHFSSNKNTLLKQLTELKETLKSHTNLVENNFSKLRDVFYRPQAYFLRLEDFGANPIHLSMVQQQIIHLISQKIQETGFELHQLGWNNDELAEDCIEASSKEKLFTSEMGYVVLNEAPSAINCEGKIYSDAEVYIEPEDLVYYYNVKANLNYQGLSKAILIPKVDIAIVSLSDSDDNAELEQVKRKATVQLDVIVAEKVLDHFINNDPFENPERSKEIASSPAASLIVMKFYADQLYAGKISLNQLAALSIEQAETLQHPIAIEMQNPAIQKEPATLDEIKTIPVEGINIFKQYYPLYSKNRANLQKLCELKKDRQNFFALPIIYNLIKDGRLPLEEALKLPPVLKSVFIRYASFFKAHHIDWKNLRDWKKENCQIACDLYQLITQKIIKFSDVPTIPSSLATLLKNEKITFLLIETHKSTWRYSPITLKDLKRLPTKQIELIKDHPHLVFWLHANIIEIKEVNTTHLFSKVYARRLFALVKGRPAIINNEEDTITKIIAELPEAARTSESTLSSLHRKILSLLLEKINHYLSAEKMSFKSHTFSKKFYEDATAILSKNTKEEAMFDELVELTEQFQKQIPKHGYLSYNKEKTRQTITMGIIKRSKVEENTSSEIRDFCDRLIAIASFTTQYATPAPSHKRLKL